MGEYVSLLLPMSGLDLPRPQALESPKMSGVETLSEGSGPPSLPALPLPSFSLHQLTFSLRDVLPFTWTKMTGMCENRIEVSFISLSIFLMLPFSTSISHARVFPLLPLSIETLTHPTHSRTWEQTFSLSSSAWECGGRERPSTSSERRRRRHCRSVRTTSCCGRRAYLRFAEIPPSISSLISHCV